MNRGIARRTLFEGRLDARSFLAGMARCVRLGWLEVHAYCLLTTHFHLLVRSPEGRLADAMQRLQLAYSRTFNRGRRRDGPLVRGRYRSKRVDSLRYRRVLVTYIDSNPVRAGMVQRACDYPYGSAWHYARASGPPWLERSWVESEVCIASGSEAYQPCLYGEAFGERVPDELRTVAARRIVSGSLEDPLDELLRASTGGVLEWMRRKAALADGTRPGLPLCEPATIDRVIAAAMRKEERPARDAADRGFWRTVRAGLCYHVASCTHAAIAARLGCSTTRAGDLVRGHRNRMCTDPEYAKQVVALVRDVLDLWKGW